MENGHETASRNQPGQSGQGDDGTSRKVAPQPPPFNPLLSHAGQGQSLGHSVVPDLMKIYESLTQSKTPHQTSHSAVGQQRAPQQFQQQPPPQQGLSYDQQASNQFHPPPAAQQQPQHAQVQVQHYTYIPQAANYASLPPQQYSQPCVAEADPVASSGRARRKRSIDKVDEDKSSNDGSVTSKSRKKRNGDDRWSKRFTWPEDLHRDFCSAIFDVGLKHASPSAILEHMPQHDQITSERVKSHLQKYRLHRVKSKKEFMSSYEASLSNFQASGVNAKSLSSGEVAAQLTYSAMNAEIPESQAPQQMLPDFSPETPQDVATAFRSGALVLPKLTDAEKHSPIGASMGYLMGLFFSLRQQLMATRNANGNGDMVSTAPYASASGTDAAQDGHHSGTVAWCPSTGLPVVTSQPSYQDAPQDTSTAAPAAPAAAHLTPASSSRTNLEESTLMKRDMQSQMALQNKMRALKQQELKKSASNAADYVGGDDMPAPHNTDDQNRIKLDEKKDVDLASEDHDGRYQGAGETAEPGNNPPGGAKLRKLDLSMGSEEFWVNDDQLFEFLMRDHN